MNALLAAGTKVETANCVGETALHWASRIGSSEVRPASPLTALEVPYLICASSWFCGGWLAKVVTILMAAGSSAKTRNADCLAPLDVACRGLLLHPPETFEGPFDETADEPPNLAGFPPLG